MIRSSTFVSAAGFKESRWYESAKSTSHVDLGARHDTLRPRGSIVIFSPMPPLSRRDDLGPFMAYGDIVPKIMPAPLLHRAAERVLQHPETSLLVHAIHLVREELTDLI